MANKQTNTGLKAIPVAASEVQSDLDPSLPAGHICESADLQSTLWELFETLNSQLSTIHSKIETLTKRVEQVESGPRPSSSQTTPHTFTTPGTESQV